MVALLQIVLWHCVNFSDERQRNCSDTLLPFPEIFRKGLLKNKKIFREIFPTQFQKLQEMKNIIIATIAVLFVSVFSANAQSVNFGSDKKTVTTTVSEEQKQASLVDEATLEYIEKLGSRRHDELMLKTSDGKTYWKGEAIDGFYIGVLGGATQDSYIFGGEFGYSHYRFDTDVTLRAGNVKFDGKSYFAPSAFFEFKPTICHFGKLKQHKLYVGGRVGYQYAESDNSIHEKGDGYEFERSSVLKGSGFGYGVVAGYEFRQFMSGSRFGVQLAAYTYDRQMNASGQVNGTPTTQLNSNKQGWQFEVTVSYKFVFHKKARNY